MGYTSKTSTGRWNLKNGAVNMETTVQVYNDQFSEVFRDPQHDLIELRWLPSTKTMSEDDFRAGLQRLAELLEKEPSPNVLIDVVNFQHESEPGFLAWRETNIIPRYNAAGVKKFAFVLPAGTPSTVEHGFPPDREGSATFPTGYFESRDGALSWFKR